MSRRRRASSVASRGQEDDSLDSLEAASSGPTVKKRNKKQDPVELCHQLYDSIRNFKKEDGTLLCDSFIRIPKRRQDPSYYEVVINPIDLLKIQQKLKTDEYEDIEDLQTDIELIVNNTKAFYKKNSQEYKDAVELWDLFLHNKTKLLTTKDEEPEPKKTTNRLGRPPKKSTTPVEKPDVEQSEDTSECSTNADEEMSQYEELFTAVMVATDGDSRPLHIPFQLLPSKKKYPEYYEIIENPIDLRSIAIKIQNGDYFNLSDMEKDLLLMTKNACTFNEPGSQIYKKAKSLKKIIQSKKLELDHIKMAAGKTSERIRNKRLRGTSCLSAVTAALRDEDSDIDDNEEIDDEVSTEMVDAESPQWQLFETVRGMTSNGIVLSEPFWKLPSRKFYPDYYREIKNPVSMFQIRRKLINRSYGTLSEVAGDLNVMFENAKTFNLPTSKLHKDAVLLQKLMQSKVKELLDIDQVTNGNTYKHKKDSDSEGDSETVLKKKINKMKGGQNQTTPGRGRPPKETVPLKKRLHNLTKLLLDHSCDDGRKPILAFMEKPSKKLYPEYYEVISDPIDMLEIELKIKNDQYNTENELIKDLKLMFANCRHFNEENSPIFEDAIILERYLMQKVGRPITPEKRDKLPTKGLKIKKVSQVEQHLRTLYETIRDYRETRANRQLSCIFMKLPSKIDYPDYYELIKNPVDIEKIAQKLKNGYDTLDELVDDFILMFDNACTYNEPDSQIYRDALVLQRLCLQTKLNLKEDEDSVPDVAGAVQDILLNLFTTVYNHQDTDERYYSDSFMELPEHDEVDGKKIRAVSFDLIKRRLDRGLYKRLDIFQDDFFACLDRARRLSRPDSQLFEDAVQLQTFFVKQRNELCKNGDILQSPALNYTLTDMASAVESMRQSKILQESLEEETETRSSEDSMIRETPLNLGETMTCNQQTFQVGEFVYLDAKEKSCEPHIILIERLWTENEQQMLTGNYYLRPAETYHLTTRKFYEKEVFKSDSHTTVPLMEVKERCCILNIKQYCQSKPEGYEDKDVYVCESRYSTRSRSFKKIKMFPENPSVKLVSREEPIEPKRIVSIFRERIEKHKDELAELQEQEKLVEKEKPNIVAYSTTQMDDGNTYYEQFNTICSGVVKTGDFVYVAADGGRQLVAQIDSIWETKDGKCYFRGPWFVAPCEVPHSTNKIFHKQELFLSSLEDKNPLVSIMGKCSVLESKHYVFSRPTEILESDTFICNFFYDEVTHQIRKLPSDGIKKYKHSSSVAEDEIYFFSRMLSTLKMEQETIQNNSDIKLNISSLQSDMEPPTQLTKINDMDMLMDDSLDGRPPSVGSGDFPVVSSVPAASSTAPISAKKKTNKKVVTGYILYSREVRRRVIQNNPDSNFGEISRLVGNEWRSLPSSEKQVWEEKASKLNEESKAALLLEEQSAITPRTSPAPAAPNPDQVYECLWDNCDYQFEDLCDCLEHCIKDKESQGHVQSYCSRIGDADIHCQWKNCSRTNKKNIQPFPNITRLIRHVRDMHINKGNGRIIPPSDRSKNYKASSKTPTVIARPVTTITSNTQSVSTPVPVVTVAQPKQEPLFISVPPRPQRVLHSEAYIKYIEGLQADNKYISGWPKILTASQENTQSVDTEKLHSITNWLGPSVTQHDEAVTALWNLRNHLMKDVMSLKKNL